MQFFAEAVFLKFFGTNAFAIRLISAVGGTLTIPLLYLLLRQMFGRTIALLGAVTWSGIISTLLQPGWVENIGDPLPHGGGALLRLASEPSRAKPVDFVLTGLAHGARPYLSPAARVIPLIVAAFFAYCVLRRPAFLRQAVPGAGPMALAYGAAALPVGVFWFTHHSHFMDRINVVGIFQSGWIDQPAGGDRQEHHQRSCGTRAVHAFGGFGRYADRGTSPHYLAPIPLVDRLSLVPVPPRASATPSTGSGGRYFLLLMILRGGRRHRRRPHDEEPPTTQRLLGPSRPWRR